MNENKSVFETLFEIKMIMWRRKTDCRTYPGRMRGGKLRSCIRGQIIRFMKAKPDAFILRMGELAG